MNKTEIINIFNDGDDNKMVECVNSSTQSELSIADEYQNTLVHYAASKGAIKTLEKLLNMGLSINDANEDASTPMHFAANKLPTDSHRYSKIVELLLDRGANPDLPNDHSDHPLSYVLKYPEVVKLFIKYDVDVNKCNVRNESYLILATDVASFETVKMLLEAGAKVDIIDSINNGTALDYACDRSKHSKCLNYGKIVTILKQYGGKKAPDPIREYYDKLKLC